MSPQRRSTPSCFTGMSATKPLIHIFKSFHRATKHPNIREYLEQFQCPWRESLLFPFHCCSLLLPLCLCHLGTHKKYLRHFHLTPTSAGEQDHWPEVACVHVSFSFRCSSSTSVGKLGVDSHLKWTGELLLFHQQIIEQKKELRPPWHNELHEKATWSFWCSNDAARLGAPGSKLEDKRSKSKKISWK